MRDGQPNESISKRFVKATEDITLKCTSRDMRATCQQCDNGHGSKLHIARRFYAMSLVQCLFSIDRYYARGLLSLPIIRDGLGDFRLRSRILYCQWLYRDAVWNVLDVDVVDALTCI